MYKTAKGATDLTGAEYRLIQDLIGRAEREFIAAGGTPLDTPVFERTDVLLGKYGEEADTKLIYRLADEGGEALALRYDLTVPFTRHVLENGIRQMRRYSIGKVYRRDQPNQKAGRFREFIQADFDIYGERQEGMLAEATVLNTVCRVLDGLGLSYTILVNDVRNLEYILCTKVGLAADKWRAVCPIIDKLDKQKFGTLIADFKAAGLDEEQIVELHNRLSDGWPECPATDTDYRALHTCANALGFGTRIRFTPSLARGLDYYTGFIWEIKLDGVASTVSAGGRYDGLLGAPTVGISIGISRLATCLPPLEPAWRDIYFIVGVGDVPIARKLEVVRALQAKGYAVQYDLVSKDRKLGKVITECATSWIRYVVIVGENELAAGRISIKDLREQTQIERSLSDPNF